MRCKMRIALFVGKKEFASDPRIEGMLEEFVAAGCEVYQICGRDGLRDHTDMLLSVGGDGTFLSASAILSDSEIPVAGVNLGRMGFLSENRPEDIISLDEGSLKSVDGVGDVMARDYTIESRTLLELERTCAADIPDDYFHALNELAVHRSGPAMLEVEVSVDGIQLPTYWADGLVISTSSGSTAYSLSVGGPIVLPESKVLIISPIAPHNLNVRPLVVPDTSRITLRVNSRDGEFIFSSDNRSMKMDSGISLSVSVAQFSLKRVRLNRSNFINALTEKLFWGEDCRNIK